MPQPHIASVMTEHTYFRLVAQIGECPTPFYLGRGVAYSAEYRSEKARPLPGHGVVKLALNDGGLFRPNRGVPVPMNAGTATLREFNDPTCHDGYDPNHSKPWEFLGLIFCGDASLTIMHGLIERYGNVYHLSLESPLVKRLLAMVHQPTHSVAMPASEGMRLVLDVLAALARSAEDIKQVSHSLRIAQEVERTIAENLSRRMTVDELARLHSMSREHLTRLFTQEFGLSPHQYSLEMRIREACRLLRQTDAPIKAIMRDVGFDTPRTFYRAFRRLIGVSPKAYRDGMTDF